MQQVLWLSFPPVSWLAQTRKQVFWTLENYWGSKCATCAEVGLCKTCTGCVHSAFLMPEIQVDNVSAKWRRDRAFCPLFLGPLSHTSTDWGVKLRDTWSVLAQILHPCSSAASTPSGFLSAFSTFPAAPNTAWHNLERPQRCVSDGVLLVCPCSGWWQGRLLLAALRLGWGYAGKERWSFMATTAAGAFLREVCTNANRHRDECEP